MRFEFQNLGTIKKTTLDLRPLTVILGPNNTSKTYLAYCVHGLIRALARQPVSVHRAGEKRDVPFELGEVAFNARIASQYSIRRFIKQLPEYFQDTYRGLFESTVLRVRIDPRDVRESLGRIVSAGDKRLTLRGDQVIVTTGPEPRANTLFELARRVVKDMTGAGVLLTLPAERIALVTNYKVLSARRYRALREAARGGRAGERDLTLLREQGGARYPAPIEDFLDFLTDAEIEAARPKNNPKSPFGKVAHLIEQAIQGGHRTIYKAVPPAGHELVLMVSKDLVIDLYNASSSIKQIAPLLLYLRYRAAPNQTLIIDEPEMNLHPEGQAKLLEALAMLANLGVRVLLTTHSPYFMAHLNNLIASDPASPARKKRQAKHLYMGDPAAFLSPDDVSAYEMRPEGLASLKDPEYGIRWDTLSDVSAELQRRYFAIMEEPKGRAKRA